MNTEEIIDRLQQTTVDLLWVSESDYPFQIVVWSDKEINLMLFPDRPDEDTKVISLDDFFAPALKVEDWYEAEELANVDRYKLLLEIIRSNLTELKVFRIGSIEIDIYIVGKTPSGDVIGLKTTIVET
jgi:Nuclease A inhibitor-like protein